MLHTDVIVIGGGQAGLAMSYCLTERGIDHVVLERGRVGERWHTASWDSLRLLTPNWMTRLPGFAYDGPDADGFMTAGEFACRLQDYALSFWAPVLTSTEVVSVEPAAHRYRVVTERGTWTAGHIVIATGSFDTPHVPPAASNLSRMIEQLTSVQYKNPAQLPPAGVLVVGASATGVQLAREIHRSGRPVTLAVGSHTRLPRRYRGHDIMWWLDRSGILDERIEDVDDIAAARRPTSLQLVGDPSDGRIDIGTLQSEGVKIVGRLSGFDGTRASFAADLAGTMRDADRRLQRLLQRIDGFAARAYGLYGREEIAALPTMQAPRRIDLARAGIRTVIWATGFRRTYPWLKLPVLDENGELVHRGGVCALPGIYALGLRFMRRRKSSFIDGCGADAHELADIIATSLRARRCAAA